MSKLLSLRPHQTLALDMLRHSLASGHRRPVMQLPTGAGKTVIAAHVVSGAQVKGNRVCFNVPAISLIDQTFERFVENGIAPKLMGVIQADHPWTNPDAPIQIASIQTLARREFPDVDFVINDEAHVQFKAVQDWMAQSVDMIFIGLTATPWSKGLGRYYDDLLKPASLVSLIHQGYLSDFRVFAPSHPDLSGVKTVAGDYHEGQLGDAMNRGELVADIVSTWAAKADGLPTLCFAVNRIHAKSIRDRFEEAGVAVEYIDAHTPREERDAIGERLKTGAIQVVVNIGCLTTGVDWDVRCLILARPTKSKMLFVQIIGRALRTADGKDHALILDHSDTHGRLGFVTDIDQGELDDGRPKRTGLREEIVDDRVPLPVECLECGALMRPSEPECPACGAPRPKPQIAETPGELAEMVRVGVKAKGRKPSVKEAIALLGKQKVYSQLRAIQLERHRSPGWVAHTYRKIFDVWPRGLDPEWEQPCALVKSYVKSLDIAYAKGRGRNVGHS